MAIREIKLRSDEVQDIMTYVPGWIVRWGITVVCMTVGMLIAVAWLIKYPDMISARVTIVSATPPIDIIARASGKLDLQVGDQTAVTTGTLLAEIENPARIEDVFALKQKLDNFKQFFTNPAAATVEFDRTAMLGEMQQTYGDFYQNLTSYRQILSHSAGEGVTPVGAQRYGDQVSKIVHQRDLLIKEVELAKKKYESSRQLFEKGLISEVELADAEKEYLEQRTTLEYVEADILHTPMALPLDD